MERLGQRFDTSFLTRELPPEFDNIVYRSMIPLTEYVGGKMGLQVEVLGDLPTTGPALIISDHPKTISSLILPWAMMAAVDRPTYMAVRDTLLDRSIKEEPQVLERTGKKGNSFVENYLFPPIVKRGGPIPVHRGTADRKFLRAADQVLQRGDMLGVFIQETRTDQDDLSNAKLGPGWVAKRNPDVPVYIMTMANIGNKVHDPDEPTSPTVTIQAPFTYRELAKGKNLTPDEIKDHITGRMVQQLARKGVTARTQEH